MLGTVNLSGVGTIAFPTGGLAELDTRLRLRFDVDEDEMFVRFAVQCAVESGADDMLDFGLELDGTLIGGGALFRKGIDAAVGKDHDGVLFEWVMPLAKGKHVVSLHGNQVGGASESIDTDVAPCALTVERVSNGAVLAHGVDSKKAGIY